MVRRIVSGLPVTDPVEILATTVGSCPSGGSGPPRLHGVYCACYLAATCRRGERGTHAASSRSHPYPPRARGSHASRLSFIAHLRCRSCPVGLRPDTDSDSGG